jgi:hypothetical protein
MSLPKILVIGATGKTAAVVASVLLRAGYAANGGNSN